jgi:hypothetical protein
LIATTFEIVGKPTETPLGVANIGYFQLRESGQLPAEKILENPNFTLYSLDFENRQTVFVETPEDVDLSQSAFYFMTQFEKAKQVLTIPFETMLQLAKQVSIDEKRLVFIHSVGRCGSTLASQIFAQVPGVINFSEPDALMQLVIARNTKVHNDGDLIALLEATIRLLGKTAAERAWVIKGRSFVIELGDWLHKLYPRARNLFLYRDAESWLESGLRAYGSGDVETTEEERKAGNKQRREILGPLVPLIAQYDPDEYLPHAGTLSLMWLRAMELYVQYHGMGIEMLAIRYADWRQSPHKTAEAMLDYCQCRPTDTTAIYETLTRDSQAGTQLSRDTLDQRKRVITQLELEELHKHLQNHAFIHEADYEVPSTLK